MIINRIWIQQNKISIYAYHLRDGKIEILGKRDYLSKEKVNLAIGGFDGFHLGHQKILERLGKERRAILTFYPLPKYFFSRTPHFHLYTLKEKLFLASEIYKIDYFNIVIFTEDFLQLKAQQFLELLDNLFNLDKLVVGFNFRYGKDREGDVEGIQDFFSKKEIPLEIVLPVKDEEGNIISSTLIREKIREGKIEKANKMLGVPFFYLGKVIKGEGRGRKLGFPTVNLRISGYKILPPFGVYLSETYLEDKVYRSLSYLGKAPTFQRNKILLETFIANFKGLLYNKKIRVALLSYLRPEKKFSSEEELIKKLEEDIANL